MKKKTILVFIISLIVFGLCAWNPLSAGENEKGKFYGGFQIGYRAVDVVGVDTKYKEDINLQNGPRLFNFKLHYLPEGFLKKFFDRLDVSLYNLGGDPFETISLNAVKYGSYTFNYNRRKAQYFYEDNLIGNDFHRFDFDRVIDEAKLKIWIGRKGHLWIDFERFTKKGSSTTTLDISRDEFELDKPINEASYDIGVGLDWSLKNLTVILEERLQDYTNDYYLFLPGMSLGEDPLDGTELNFFFFNQPYDFRNFSHNLRLNFKPVQNLLIKARAQINSQNLRFSYSETIDGIAWDGSDLNYGLNGNGKFDRNLQLYDLDVTYLFSSKLASVAAIRYHKFDQQGETTVNEADNITELAFNTLSIEAGLQYQFSSKVGLTLGFRNETRETEFGHEEAETENESTKRTGFFGNLNLHLSKAFSLTADYQMGVYTNPFTFISPEDFMRLRITAKYKVKKFYLKGSYLYKISETSIPSSWTSDRNQINLRAGFRGSKVSLSLGYALINVKHQGTREIDYSYGTDTSWNILYDGTTHLIDAYAHVSPNKNWTFGGYLNSYQNNGSWELSRFMAKLFVEYLFDGGVVVKLAYRYIDFNEKDLGLNDYTANIFEIGFGYRW